MCTFLCLCLCRLCALCGKTFCDRGALKIHTSAVHLRHMHPCLVAGCAMWFSSRRSRYSTRTFTFTFACCHCSLHYTTLHCAAMPIRVLRILDVHLQLFLIEYFALFCNIM